MKKYRKNIGKIAKKNKNFLDLESDKKFVYLIVGLLSVLFLIAVMAEGGDISIVLGRIIGLAIISVLSYMLVNWISTITEETEVLKEKKEFESDKNLQMEEISILLERASDGKTKSQEILHNKIKDIFFIKLKETRNLSKSELRSIVKKPERFRSIVQDDMIADFILSLEIENEDEFDPEEMDKEQYKDMIRKMIQEISKWD